MPTKSSIGVRMQHAYDRLEQAMGVIAGQLDIDAPALPRKGRYPDILRAEQLEILAEYAERVAGHVGGEIVPIVYPGVVWTDAIDRAVEAEAARVAAPPPDYHSMDMDELLALAEQRGIVLYGLESEADIIAALREADGLPVDPDGPATYDTMTVPELRALAEQRGIDLEGLRLKADIIVRLEDADLDANDEIKAGDEDTDDAAE